MDVVVTVTLTDGRVFKSPVVGLDGDEEVQATTAVFEGVMSKSTDIFSFDTVNGRVTIRSALVSTVEVDFVDEEVS